MSDWSETLVEGIPCRWFSLSAASRFTVIVLADPGESDLDDQMIGSLLDQHRLSAVAPRVSSWWLDRPEPGFPGSTTPARFLSETLTSAIRERWPEHAQPLGIFGVGRGGQGALQAAYRSPRVFPVVAAIRPAIDFHRVQPDDLLLSAMFSSSEAARQQTATLNLHPMNWPPHQWLSCDPADRWHDGCDRLASKLRSIGIPFEADLQTTTGGDLTRYVLLQAPLAVGFLAERLVEVAQ